MIVVLGRPVLTALPGTVPPLLAADSARSPLDGLASSIALEVARRGGRVELVGSIGDDHAGDEIVVELGRAGIGHAALLRDPGGTSPVAGRSTSQLPRLDAADVELGLRYVADYHVLILADPLSPDAEMAAIEGAAYHGATLIAVLPGGAKISSALSAAATVLEQPTAEGDAEDDDEETRSPGGMEAFPRFVAALAVRLDEGSSIAEAFPEAARSTGWEHASGA